jgi:hypothetical protein
MKGLRARRIQIKLSRVLGNDCYSPAVIECWLARFREGDLSRSGGPAMDISECLGAFPDKFPFARVNVIAKHFRITPGTIMEIMERDSGLKKFSRQSVPRRLSLSQKADPVNRSRALQSSILSHIPPIVLYSSNNLTHHFSH